MPKAKAELETDRASRYLQAMFKHFAHKVDVDYDEHAGSANMPDGHLSISAEGGVLTFCVEADDVQKLLKTRYVIDAHIVRFAFKEKLLGLNWQSSE